MEQITPELYLQLNEIHNQQDLGWGKMLIFSGSMFLEWLTEIELFEATGWWIAGLIGLSSGITYVINQC